MRRNPAHLHGCPIRAPTWTPARERLLEESLERRHRDLDRRERLGNRAARRRRSWPSPRLLALLADAERAFSPLARARVRRRATRVVGARRALGRRRATPCRRRSCSCRCCCCCRRRSCRCSSPPAIVLAAAAQALRGGAALGRSALAVGDAWFSARPGARADRLRRPAARLGALAGLRRSRSAAQLAHRRASSTLARMLGLPAASPPRDVLARPAAGLPRRRAARSRSACSPRSPPPTRPRRRCWCCRSPTCCCPSRASARRSMRKSLELGRAYRGTALLLRDLLEEDDEYTGRHTEDVVGLTVAVAERMGLDEDLRRAAELGRAAARHRQDRRARRDHQQARPARRRGVGDHEDPHRRGRADARPGRRPARRRRPRRARLARALGRRRLPRRPRRRRDPARGLHRLRLRRLQRDDDRPLLPQGAAARRSRSASCRRTAARSSARPSSTRSSELVLEAEAAQAAESRPGSSPWLQTAAPGLLRRSRRPARPSQPRTSTAAG